MLHDYDKDEVMPEYADARYKGCLNVEEAKILRLVLSYCEYVELRYGKPEVVYTSFQPDEKNRSLRTHRNLLKPLTHIVEELGDTDPASFMSYIFETWKGRESYAKFAKSKKKWLTDTAGITYPGMTYIVKNADSLLKEFLNIPGYEPRGFVTRDERHRRYDRAMQNKVKRWVGCHEEEEKTEADYWRVINHLLPPHLNYQDIPHAKSLYEHESVLLEEFGFSVEELYEYLKDVWDTPVRLPITRIPDEEWLDSSTLERIALTNDALKEGTDVTTDEFQAALDETIHPVDMEHPDTVLYYLFGHGKPRRES